MILFLDFDGVTHPVFQKRELSDDENQLFSYLPRLEGVLRDFPNIKIVIASSWRENRPWKNIIGIFSPDISARIIGATPILKVKEPPYPKHPRYEEILSFLSRNNFATAQWVALDDDPGIYPPDCQNVILCADGFRDAEEHRLRVTLGMMQKLSYLPIS